MHVDLSDRTWPVPWRKDPVICKKAPELLARDAELYQRQFVSEGMLLALPTSIPGQTEPIPDGESALTTLTVAPDGVIYGGTSGRHAHLVCAMLHGATGFVRSLGRVEGARESVAASVADDGHVYLAVNSPERGWIMRRPVEPVPFDCVQEWFMSQQPLVPVCEPLPGRRICDAVMCPGGHQWVVLAEDGMLATVELDGGKVRVVGPVDAIGRFGRALAIDAAGVVYGTCFDGRVWLYSPEDGGIEKTDMFIPCGAGRQHYNAVSTWAVAPAGDRLYGASSADGTLFDLEPGRQRVRSLGRIISGSPVNAISVTVDGRVFGLAGGDNDIARMFVYDPDDAELKDLGICVSTLSARAYGFVFKSAACWRNGTLLFGEADRISHLWAYFPALKTK